MNDSSAATSAALKSGLLKLPQLVLMVMSNKYGTGWTVRDLVKVTGGSRTSVTMAKNCLLARGDLVEHFPEEDRRLVKVYLTDAGRTRGAAMWEALQQLSDNRTQILAWAAYQSDIAAQDTDRV